MNEARPPAVLVSRRQPDSAGGKRFHRVRAALLSSRVLLLLLVLALCLRFIGLGADFPSDPWHDWEKLTDEGWHTHAALSFVTTGHWYVPGDFNVAVSVPLLQVVEAGIFKMFGAGAIEGRSLIAVLSVGSLVFTFLLIRELEDSFTAWTAVIILATSYFCFAYSRLILLEYPTLAFGVAGLYLIVRQRYWPAGVVFALAVLTKMTAGLVFIPAAYLLWTKAKSRRQFLNGAAAMAVCVGGALVLHYVVLLHRFPEDFRYYSAINVRDRANFTGLAISAARALYHGVRYVDRLLVPLAMIAIIAGAANRAVRQKPLFASSALWLAGYGGYLTILHYSPPRYYIVPMVPLICCLVVVIRSAPATYSRAALALVAVAVALNLWSVASYLAHPRYSFSAMAKDVRTIADSEAGGRALVMGNFANSLTLMSGIPSVNDVWATSPLDWRLATYRPTHYVSMGGITAEMTAALARSRYAAVQLKSYEVFQDPTMPLYLYRLEKDRGPTPDQ